MYKDYEVLETFVRNSSDLSENESSRIKRVQPQLNNIYFLHSIVYSIFILILYRHLYNILYIIYYINEGTRILL